MHNNRSRALSRAMALLVVVALAVLTAACGSGGDDSGAAGGGGTAAEPKQGGRFTFVPQIDVTSLDPVKWPYTTGGSISSARGLVLYDALVVYNDGTSKVEPRMLESLESTPDGKVWTLKVRPGITFTDGTPFDAKAIEAQWKRAADPASNSLSQPQAADIASIEVTDPLTLKATLKRPDGQFPTTLQNSSGLVFIASPTAVAKYGADYGSSADKVVGAGPFVAKEWIRDSRLTATRNPGYYDKAYLDEVVIATILDTTQAYNTLAGGGVDGIVSIDPRTVDKAKAAGLVVSTWTPHGGRGLGFNTAKAPFDDPIARQAVAAAFDAERAAAALYGGAAAAAVGAFHEDSPFFDKSVKWPTADKAEAQRLFDEYAAKHGKPLSFTILAPNVALFTDDAQWLQSVLKSYKNVQVQYETTPGGPAVQSKLRAGTFDVWIFATSYTDPAGLADVLRPDGSLHHYTFYNSPKVTELLDKDRAITDQAARVELWSQIQQEIAKDVPFVFKLRQPFYTLLAKRAHGADTGETVFGGTPDFRRVFVD